ncbi:hypothetical protein CLAFUW4_06232 [Fulvia fulva]|uniref:Uncharacterized protein n=1 Tax=Passalora fulva TaxID=5499 RepID=A0A9Q8P8V3_PASFU|nr:uncharacterized protein CLAFUR5_06375 [Fulvia fulva]KAK4623920.1 hypothetical protein CLAFUR4_06235 [Fulvia fulva]KAK4626040.1 hypothetical protein CLAFUR0_06239 [Fulvia fulva]UJO17625.1 hypothetical protein CLAFUR5_06375 [Fulvia fulva]WPV15599.1 hypothetical protein CLAFUW4_06232 [Fulvia fulva]WPV29381.1 hypothetical protein CLAFUW7_06228 [Fulvia fulva]
MNFLLPTLTLITLAYALPAAEPRHTRDLSSNQGAAGPRLLKALARRSPDDFGWCVVCGLQFVIPGGACDECPV